MNSLFCRSTNCALTPMPLGIHFIFIGDSLSRHWGLTPSLLGTHWSCDPMKIMMNNYAEIVKKFVYYLHICEKFCIFA
jgi:hypothetical protein